MAAKWRLFGFGAGGAVLAWLFCRGVLGLEHFGSFTGAYGLYFNAVTVASRHITNVPTAINFDYRGLDTMGEEYILFGSVVGTLTLLRQMRRQMEEAQEEEVLGRDVEQSDAVRLLGLIMTGLLIVFGIYIVVHAHLTPGGGFQGGAMVGTAAVLVYLAGSYEIYERLSPAAWMEFGHASGAGAYVIIGLCGLIFGGSFLKNVLPLGVRRPVRLGRRDSSDQRRGRPRSVHWLRHYLSRIRGPDAQAQAMNILPYIAAAWIFLVGLYGVLSSRNLIHLVICLSVAQSATYVLLIAIGYRTGQGAPIFADVAAGTPAVDPVVQALTLTDIVVGATVSALLLALAVQVYKHRGSSDPDQLRPLHRDK